MNFDMCIFLLEGQILYHGPIEDLTAHFSKFDFHCPQNYNPADYLMFLCQTESISGSLSSAKSIEAEYARMTQISSEDDLQKLISMEGTSSVRDVIIESKAVSLKNYIIF